MAKGEEIKMGRPIKFTPELGAEICLRITTKPFPENSLTRICNDEDMPCRTTVYTWVLNASTESATAEEKDFLNRYNTAHLIKIDNMYDESFEIAYDDEHDILEGEKGSSGNSTNVARARLKVDLIKWALSKLNPQKYGERIHQEISGTITMTPHEKMMLDMMEKTEKIKADK